MLNTALFVVFYFLAMFVYVRYFKIFGRSEQYIFLIIFIAPLIGLVGHLTNEHIPFLLMNNVFCYMILAMNIQYINASTDFLTGLANRRSLSNHLHNRMTGSDKQSSFSIIMFDLDNFKMINDTMGHNVGDDALRQFGRFLRNKGCRLRCPLWWHEFILVLDSMSPEQLTQKSPLSVALNFMKAIKLVISKLDSALGTLFTLKILTYPLVNLLVSLMNGCLKINASAETDLFNNKIHAGSARARTKSVEIHTFLFMFF